MAAKGNASTTRVASKSKGKAQTYVYTALNEVQVDSTVNIFAVVKFFKAPYQTRGTDLCQVLSVVDESLDAHSKLRCLFFIRPPAEAPPVKVGNIVRFHRLKVVNHNGDMQGNNGPGFSWLVFDGVEGTSLEPHTSSTNYTLTDVDKEKVKQLRKWIVNQQSLGGAYKPVTIADLIPGGYANVACQVVATCVIEMDVCLLMRVWDGTRSIYPVRELDTDREDCDIDQDSALWETTQGFIYDVCLFDDHFEMGKSIKPGAFIELRNLHAVVYKNTETREEYQGLQTLELTVHGGTAFGRGIFRLSPGSVEIISLTIRLLNAIKEKLRHVTVQDDGSTTTTPGHDDQHMNNQNEARVMHTSPASADLSGQNERVSGEGRDGDERVVKVTRVSYGAHDVAVSPARRRKRQKHLKKSAHSGDEEASFDLGFSTQVSSPELVLTCDQANDHSARMTSQRSYQSIQTTEQRTDHSIQTTEQKQRANQHCMMETVTVLTAHHHIKVTPLREVINHQVPFKFRIQAKLVDYQPRADTAQQFITFFCPSCLFVSSASTGLCDVCPQCIDNNPTDVEAVGRMKCTYMVKLLLNDDRDWLVTNLWREHAIKFFRDITPEDALVDLELFQGIQQDMSKLMGDDQSQPWLECNIMSYTGQSGTCYQIFDTTIL